MKRLLLVSIAMLAAFQMAIALDVARARQILNVLSSDEFEGRRSGHPGGRRTEEYLAETLRGYGVQPGAKVGYFQEVPMLVTDETRAELTLMDHELGQIPFQLGVDFQVMHGNGSGDVLAPVVLVGYGIVRPDKGRDDYGSVNVANKVVFILRGQPASPWDFQTDSGRRRLLQWAEERKVAAVLLQQDPWPIAGAAISPDVYKPDLPMLMVGDRLLRLLLDGTGYSAETYREKLKHGPLPLETGKRVWVSTESHKLSKQHARNVIGFIYGTDPVLKNEVVVIGGHMDHIGKNPKGVIYNGADDNASGTALVSELARTFAESPLRRSILIAHFTGEENGLDGSTYFVENPSVPFGNIAGMINLDCEGMGSGSVAMVGGELFGPLWEEYVGGLDSAAVAGLRRSRDDGSASSDFAPFDRAGCPSIAFWSRGDHPFYHHYEDDSRWISDSVMAAVGRRAEDFLRFLGNHDGSLACRLDSLRVLARMALNFDFGGFAIDPPGTFPESPVMTAAWLPSEAAATYAELIRRATELQGNCAARSVSCAGLKETIKNFRSHQKTVFMGMNEADLSLRRPAEVAGLIRQGLAVVRLAAGSDARALNSDAVEAARRGGVFALVPFDFNAAGRIERWKTQAVVTASLTAFAAAPPSVRDGLLSSDALLILDASSLPMRAEIETLLPGAARRVHLNFGSVPAYRREEQARGVIQSLFNAGLTREEILLLIGGNLRRFFDS